ncbi:sulfite oxidase heme-binding subunit YedZ [Methylocella sp.]|uniref:sulfite oxidase heme-binding subunit YedZ n=1 Tax=Methylocella sp. TaxID=1978226 RepID=UPI0037839C46
MFRVGAAGPRFDVVKAGAYAAAVLPGLWLAAIAAQGGLGPRPLSAAIHAMGLWALRMLALSLAVTPARIALRDPRLFPARRIFGLAALAYVAAHVTLYVADQSFRLPHVAAEIVRRPYLTIGFLAFLALCVLGATSGARMTARLGPQRWRRLHRLVYPAAGLAAVHFFMQKKLDVSEPIAMAGIFGLLFAFRLATRRYGEPSLVGTAALALGCAFATALAEAGWFALSAGAPASLVLAANLNFAYSIRPAWFVLGAGAVLVGARAARRRDRPASRRKRRVAAPADTAQEAA